MTRSSSGFRVYGIRFDEKIGMISGFVIWIGNAGKLSFEAPQTTTGKPLLKEKNQREGSKILKELPPESPILFNLDDEAEL
jgi:hypothetical protein